MANKSPYQQPLNDLYAAYHSGREGLSTKTGNSSVKISWHRKRRSQSG